MNEFNQYKKQLEFSAIRFEAIARTATDSIVISDADSTIVYANRKTYEIFGYPEGELLGTELGMLMPEKFRKAHQSGMQGFMLSGVPKLIGHTIEVEGLRKDGTVFPIELSLSSWKEEENYFFSGIIRDISKRKKLFKDKEEANLRLREQQEKLAAANEELQVAYEEVKLSQENLQLANNELLRKGAQLKNWNNELEGKVRERTFQLEKQKEWLENLFMQVPAIIALLMGPEGRVSLHNPMFQQLWGGRELEGKNMHQAWPELEGQGYFEIIKSVFDTGETIKRNEYPVMIDRQNSGVLVLAYLNLMFAPYYDKSGEVKGVLIYGEDVSEQVGARKLIEESAARFRFMADAMPQKVWTAKENGSVDYCNQNWLEYTGLSFEEIKDWGWKDAIHPADWKETEKGWLHALETGEDYQMEHRIKRIDGQYRWHLSRGIAQTDENGEISIWIGTNTDVHDKRVAQEKLLAAQAELKKSNDELKKRNIDLDNFVYTASHDLKSPISNMEGLLGLMRPSLESKLVEKEKLMLEMFEKSIFRLKKTIADLTEITRAQKVGEEPHEEVFFADVLEDVKSDMETEIAIAGATIIEDFAVTSVKFSKNNLRSILFNLLSNAVKYRSEERPVFVKINTFAVGTQVVLQVTDNGLGLSEQQLPKLFTMFKRLHKHVEGTGIGLYIIKRIVENYGGNIEVSSKIDEGTTFKVLFGNN